MNLSDLIISVYPFTITFLYLCTLAAALFAYFARAYMLYTGNVRLDSYLYGLMYTPNAEKK
ncbi:MAG: hypothetical protein IIX93_01600, partial [Clostridia bacterium]|nr:hypothetical protein [Clostridia bacterium]